MAKLDPFSLKRVSSVSETRTFSDPLQPEASLTLSFTVSPDASARFAAQSKTRDYVRQFVTGDEEYQRTKDQPEPAGTAPTQMAFDGEPIFINPVLCAIIAELAAAEEAGTPPDDCYSFEAWAILSKRMPTAFEQITDWLDELTMRARGLAKNV